MRTPFRGDGLAPYESTNDILQTVQTNIRRNSRASCMGPVPLKGKNALEMQGRFSNGQRTRIPLMGFSLIELMVSLSIFSIVMTISLGTLLTLIDANTKAQALSSSMTNISFALDSISRNLRTGKDYYCAGDIDTGHDELHDDYNGVNDCPNGNTVIVFTPGLNSEDRIAYRLNEADHQIEQWVDVNGPDDTWVPITSNTPPGAVTINEFTITVVGSDPVSLSDEVQPQIAILIDGEVDAGLPEPTEFRVQTNITQRILNY